MVEEVTLPASTAYDLAQSAADARNEEVDAGRLHNAESLKEAEFELFEASLDAKGGQLVSVDVELVSTAAAFSANIDASNIARSFLENIGYW